MRSYIIRRILLIFPTVFVVSMMVFFLTRVMPGDMVDFIEANSYGDKSMTKVERDALSHELGLDVSIPIQYGRWLGVYPQEDGNLLGILQGDLGKSLWSRTSVADQVMSRLPVTIELGFLAFIVSQLMALPIGVYSALRQDTWGDYGGRSFAILALSIPNFWLATLVIVFPSIWWNYFPPIGLIHFTDNPIGNLKIFLVPAIVLGLTMAGGTMRMTRTMMLEVLRQDYIRAAWAKGLSERVVIIRHALKNALIPVVTMMGLQLMIMIGGSVAIEQIFGLPGIGRLMLDTIATRDYPVVSGILLLFSLSLMVINLLTDLTYASLDPRVRYR